MLPFSGGGHYLYNLEEGLRRYPVIRNKDGTGQKLERMEQDFHWLPPSRCRTLQASETINHHQKYQQKSPSVDREQILKDFGDYAATETDRKNSVSVISMTGNYWLVTMMRRQARSGNEYQNK